MTPDFLVIGAYKCGTTALHHYLRAHPGLFVPERKEPNYFAFAGDRAPFEHPAAAGSIRDRADYDALFRAAPAGQIRGEVSPACMPVSGACSRIRAQAPGARLVAVLRNPVERAYSDFMMYRRDGLECESSFVRALEAQPTRDAATDPTSHYISTGCYGAQLSRYLEEFPREQIHVVLHEDLRDDRDRTLRDLFAFLGVDSSVIIDEQAPSNVSGEPDGMAIRAAYSLRRRAGALRPIVPEGIRRHLDARLQQKLVRAPVPEESVRMLSEIYRDDVADALPPAPPRPVSVAAPLASGPSRFHCAYG